MNIFGGYEDFKHIFWGANHKVGLYLGVISMHFSVFSLGQGTEWGIFLGVAKISNIFGVLEIPDNVRGRTVDAGPEPTYVEKMRVPPPPPWGLSLRCSLIRYVPKFRVLSLLPKYNFSSNRKCHQSIRCFVRYIVSVPNPVHCYVKRSLKYRFAHWSTLKAPFYSSL